MNRKVSRVAVIAFIFGCMGIFFSQVRAVVPLLVSIPLGPVAVCSAALALRLIRRKHGTLGGRGLAMWGGTLGFAGTILGIIGLAGLFAQQFDPDHWRQEQAQQLQRVVRRRSTSREIATNFTSNLPIVVLHGDPDIASKHSDLLVDAEFFDLGEDKRASLARKPAHSGLITIHPRGTSSLQLPKHSYTFHTVDAQTNQMKVELFGLPKDDDWILYAPFEDKTLIRDVLAYELSNKMGQYAPRTRYIELFCQNSDGPISMRDYQGVYVLVEKIKRGHDRVNIAKLTPEQNSEPDISGGYIVKRDHGDGSGRRFRTEHGGPYFFVYPSERAITREQRSWLTKYFNDFEDALYGPDFADPRKGYAAYLDTGAFIDLHWLIELSKNVDGFRYSSFITKDRGGKIKVGPAWDWNRSFGNANYYNGWQTQGWYWHNLRPNEISWYGRLREDPAFEAKCRARWRQLRKDVLDSARISARIDELAALLGEAQQRNFQRWPILGQQVTCNHFVGGSFEEEVNWLKKWIERRIAWIDKQVTQGVDTADARIQ
jgi:hypothetical protein